MLVSTSGGSGGAAGARAWARAQDPAMIDGVLVLGDLASREWHKPWVVPWSNGRDNPPIALERTVEAAARQETGTDPGGSRATAQWSRRALPLTVSRAGRGQPRAACPPCCCRSAASAARRRTRRSRASSSPGWAAARCARCSRSTGPGRGAGRAAFANETDGIVTARNLLPTWSVRLIVLCLLLPALLAALDAYFRARRHHLNAGVWVAWVLAAGLVVPVAWAWLRILGITGALPAPRGPVLPADLPLTAAQAAALASTALAIVLGVVIARLLDPRRSQGAREPGGRRRRAPPSASSSARSRWSSGCSTRTPPRCWCRPPTCGCSSAPRRRGCAGSGAGSRSGPGWSLPLAVLVAELDALRIGPFSLARLWLLATAGGHVSAWSSLAVGAVAGCVAALVRVLLARRHLAAVAPPDQRPRTRGPASYAGPGSLGGTESALRR